jgi:uncharacterized membrane protein (UPF0136 family)
MDQAIRIILLLYAILLVIGGIMGKVQGGSTVSLIAGSVSGALVLGCWIWSLRAPSVAGIAGGVVALLVAGMFLKRYLDTHKVMPSLVFLLISVVVVLLLVGGSLALRAQSPSIEGDVPGESSGE